MRSIEELPREERDAIIFAMTDMVIGREDIIITDPENDYQPLIERLGGKITDETRRESFETIKQNTAARRRVILDILTENGGMTAREVAAELHRRGITPTDERNFAAPRLSELYKARKIEAIGKKLCAHSGRNVAVWAIRKE